MRASGKTLMGTGRLLALAVAIIIPACGNPTGRPVTTGLAWNSQASSGVNTTGPGPAQLQWNSPNTGLGGGQTGITQLITSTDLATYDRYNVSTKPPPFNSFISYILSSASHPLATDTNSTALTGRESSLEGLVNSLRGQSATVSAPALPNVGGGGGGIGGIGGMGGNVGGGSPLASTVKGTQCARAHCKHYAYFHSGFPGNQPGGWTLLGPAAPYFLTPETNAEGDYVARVEPLTPADTVGAPAPGNPLSPQFGRLGKIGVSANRQGWCEYAISGPTYQEATDVYPILLAYDPDILRFVNWTHLCVGHWIGGPDTFYWDVIFLINPNPSF